jgi:hypothetical protein
MSDLARRRFASALAVIALLPVVAAVGDGVFVKGFDWWDNRRLLGFAAGRMGLVALALLLVALCLHRVPADVGRRERWVVLSCLVGSAVALAGTAANLAYSLTFDSDATFKVGVAGAAVSTAVTIVAAMFALWFELRARPPQPRVWNEVLDLDEP